MRTVKDSQGREFVHTSVLVPVDVHQKVRSLRINMSETCVSALSGRVQVLESQENVTGC